MEICKQQSEIERRHLPAISIWLLWWQTDLSVMGVRVGDQSIGIDENMFVCMKIVGVAYSRNKFALRIRLRNLNLKSQFSIFGSFRDIRVHTYDFLKFVGVKEGASIFFGSIDRY